MKIRATDCTMVGGEAFLSVLKGSNVDAELAGNQTFGTKRMVEERDPVGHLQALGLSGDTPPEVIVAVLNAIRAGDLNTPEQVEGAVRANWSQFLTDGASVATIVQTLSSWSPAMISAVLALFGAA